MLQRNSCQTLVLRTEFGARAAVTRSGLNQTPPLQYTSVRLNTLQSNICVLIRVRFEELQHRSAYVLMLMCLLGVNDAICSLYHPYHSAQLYSFSFTFLHIFKGDDTQVNMSWQVKYKLSMNFKKIIICIRAIRVRTQFQFKNVKESGPISLSEIKPSNN